MSVSVQVKRSPRASIGPWTVSYPALEGLSAPGIPGMRVCLHIVAHIEPFFHPTGEAKGIENWMNTTRMLCSISCFTSVDCKKPQE